MNWLDAKYVNLLSGRLRNFKGKGSQLWNFSCPFCGDSQSDKRSARGYVFHGKHGDLRFFCQKCNKSCSIGDLVEHVDPILYGEYRLERLKETGGRETRKSSRREVFLDQPEDEKPDPTKWLSKLKKVSQLDPDHQCKLYVVGRKIPNFYHSRTYYCPRFMAWTNKMIPGKFGDAALRHDDARLIVPFFYKGKMHAYQGRSLAPDAEVKYVSIVLDDSVPKVYGLDTVDVGRTAYVFEGPIDSMFIDNSVAAAGGDLASATRWLEDPVIVYDNEPRHTHTVAKIEKAIDQGFKVVIWPSDFRPKDVNDAVKDGWEAASIKTIVDENTHRGPAAKLALSRWKRC